MFWLFQLASFTGSFPPPVNRINALGSRNSCSEDNILAGDNKENVFLADKITHSTECKPATFLEQKLSKIVHVIHVRFTRYYKESAVQRSPSVTLHNIAMFALSTHDCKCQLSKERKFLSVPLTETVTKGFR